MTIERRLNGVRRPHVLIGVGPKVNDRDTGEAWTRNRRMLMRLRERMDPDTGWSWIYPRRADAVVIGDPEDFLLSLKNRGFAMDKPWLTRRASEDLIRTELDIAPATGILLPHIDASDFASVPAERVFNLLVQDGVLKHPTARAVRGFHLLLNRGSRPMVPADVWTVDQDERDSWFAARLLVLPERWP